MKRLWNAINLVGHWRAIDEDTRREEGWKPGFDWRVLVILVFACVTLTLQEYIGDRNYFEVLRGKLQWGGRIASANTSE